MMFLSSVLGSPFFNASFSISLVPYLLLINFERAATKSLNHILPTLTPIIHSLQIFGKYNLNEEQLSAQPPAYRQGNPKTPELSQTSL